MGKPTGFLEYARVERPAVPARERLGSYGEFHSEPGAEARTEQGARCMNCGVPFCQSDYGCPLHNLIPEWNDEISARNMEYAMRRLLKTNDFPEFTGRVCPALCENACVCSLNGEAVTVRDNELAVIENAWAAGLMKPEPPLVRTGKRVAVVGSGPAGLAAAQQLNRRGHSVTVYERDDRPGGLLMYGIPNMKLDKSVVLRRIAKMEAEGIRFVCGTDVGKDLSSEELKAGYDAVILCCGARKERSLGVDTEGVRGVVSALDYLSAATRSLMDGCAWWWWATETRPPTAWPPPCGRAPRPSRSWCGNRNGKKRRGSGRIPPMGRKPTTARRKPQPYSAAIPAGTARPYRR